MKIAIASTGLGHVARGIETWALDTANALHRRGIDVTLFSAAPVATAEAPLNVVPCLRRGSRRTQLIVNAMPRFTWRWGLKSDYALEQLTFWISLRRRLRHERFDILHVQDPFLADLCRRARLADQTLPRVILAHGTEEPLRFLAPFDYLQHLAPWHLEQAVRRPDDTTPAGVKRNWTSIPNFVDTDLFRPVPDLASRRALRRSEGLPEEAFILGTAAAIKRQHKRIDWLIREFVLALAAMPDVPLHLVIAGSNTADLPALEALARERCPQRVTFLPDYPHARMPDLLRTFDVFALASLFEMMPIALLEAIASGLPVLTHTHPVLEWAGGPGGIRLDMQKENALAETLKTLTPELTATLAAAARKHATECFSETVIIGHYIDYYHDILKCHPPCVI